MTIDPKLRAVVSTFFDSDRVLKKVDKGKRTGMIRSGAYTVKIAKNSFRSKNAGRKRIRYDELTSAQKSDWKIRVWIANKKGEKPPKLPFAPARREPGKPPRSKKGTLKKQIYFGYDATNNDVVAGSVFFDGQTTAHLLEHSGRHVFADQDGKPVSMHYAGNPFMGPAAEAAAPKIPDFFRDCVRP